MYKLLIVDDEPLVQVGIKSMLNWADYDIEVCGTALNGQVALQIIEEQSPDIVISDIKMPVMSGLELARKCRELYGSGQPEFIILTSYEDFHMAKEALTYQVSDYLVKLELTPDILSESIHRVLEKIHKSEDSHKSSSANIHPFYDKFLISLLHNLFESEEQFVLQGKDLKLDFHYANYICCYGEIVSSQADGLPTEKQLSLFTSSLQMIKELIVKYIPCYALSLDMRHFALIFCCESVPENISDSLILPALRSISSTLGKYYNVCLRCGIGTAVGNPLSVCDSYQCSRQAYLEASPDFPFVFYDNCCTNENQEMHRSFNISLFKSDLTRAFEEYDSEILQKTIVSICDLFQANPGYYVQALDAASNILYLAISLLQDGETIVSSFFPDNPDGYRSIYKQNTVEQIINWLTVFSSQLCHLFESKRKDHKNHVVTNVKKYINEHIREHMTLNEVAAVFGISPSYLSQLFGKYSDTGFSEYINICKINESKRLLTEGNLKVYEVAEMLGFESAFYFSKVFKKVEGMSPTDYLNSVY